MYRIVCSEPNHLGAGMNLISYGLRLHVMIAVIDYRPVSYIA
eukprot:SAG22_NODE_152_length_17377_cov_191.856928_21_plen_42_part_00